MKINNTRIINCEEQLKDVVTYLLCNLNSELDLHQTNQYEIFDQWACVGEDTYIIAENKYRNQRYNTIQIEAIKIDYLNNYVRNNNKIKRGYINFVFGDNQIWRFRLCDIVTCQCVQQRFPNTNCGERKYELKFVYDIPLRLVECIKESKTDNWNELVEYGRQFIGSQTAWGLYQQFVGAGLLP